jgi:glycosyltransferase involved in cell wall biosynthesis
VTKLVVYVPTYNRLESLKTCLSSIAPQIQDGVRVYVSDNASTDGTAEYLSKLDYPWLTVYRQPENYGGAYNQACAWYIPLETEYVWVIGDDDYLLPNAFEVLLDAIEKHPVDFIFCNTQAYPGTEEARVLQMWRDGKLPKGTIKGRHSSTVKCSFAELVDPRVADSLLLEIMCLCARKDAIRPVLIDNLKGMPNGTFREAGRFYTGVTAPLLESFDSNTTALYVHPPLTFNFWGGGNGWAHNYDFVFPVAILYMIEMYYEKQIIDREKYLWLLDYYFKLMDASFKRQMEGTSTAAPFSDSIVAQINASYEILSAEIKSRGNKG